MFVPMEDVVGGVSEYVKTEILPNLPTNGVAGFGVGVAAALALRQGEKIIRNLAAHPLAAMLDVVTDAGVDVDALKDAAMEAMPAEGLSIDIGFGANKSHKLTFVREDVKKLYSMITR